MTRRYSEATLRGFIESLGNPIFVEQGGRVRAANEAYLEMLGLGREQVEGRFVLDFIHPEDRGRLEACCPQRYLLPDLGRGVREVAAHVQEVELEGSGQAMLVNCMVLGARPMEDVERCQWEMAVVAETARFITQPEPPSPEAFLSRLATLLGAASVRLYIHESSEGALRLSAQVGLEGALEIPSPPTVVAKGAVLSSEAEERALMEATGGRLGRGAAVRLFQGGHPRGLLQVLRPPERPFGGADLRLLGTLAELLMTLLEQRRLNAECARQLSDTRLLLDLARTTSTTLEVASLLEVASEFLVKLLDISNCFILLHDERAQVLRAAAASSHRDFFRSVVIPLDDPHSAAARAARERRPVAIPDVERAAGLVHHELIRILGEKAVLALPLTSREELIGVVLLDDTRGPRAFSPAFLELAGATCGQLSLAIANARLYESLWASYAELAATRAEMVKRERLAALGEMSAIVAHEVRNPLGVIFNAVASLRRMFKAEGDAAMLLDILSEESDRLNRIVGTLLDYTRPREPLLQPEDVLRVMRDAVETAQAEQGGGGRITFTVDVAPELPRVPMDRRLIRQALVNVLVNAIQSMPQGGEVRVDARRETQSSREMLRIGVKDQGCGIPVELLHRVQQPFFTTKAQGTGLGLAVVKRILEEHHGELALESTPGRGTLLTLYLPLTQPTSQP